MSNSVTMQDLVQLENDYLNQIREINTTHRYDVEGLELKLFKAEHDNVTKDVLLMNAEYEIANLTTLLEQEKYKAIQVERAQRKHLTSLDNGWNKTIDAHEVTKSRLALYENEVGIPHNKGIADHRLNG